MLTLLNPLIFSHAPYFQVQLLLFSATFNDIVKRFAMQIAPTANHLFVAKEQLSLDVIAQYNVRCEYNNMTLGLRGLLFCCFCLLPSGMM